FLAFALFPSSTFWIRPAPALFSLAAFAAATRLRSTRWLAIGGAALALAFLTSLDFGFYTAAIVVVWIAPWPRRLRALGFVAAGFFAVLLPALLLSPMAFVPRTIEIVRTGRVFIIGPLSVPECLRSVSAMIWQLPNPRCLSAVLWVLTVLL